ncbi:hypothetical protein [Methanobrevibacter sp.]|uniref:hypothetical protein n=1 Tax=Methanobrevibacter sp. TaxID=66852 RepID=UPI0038635EE3
MTLDEWHKLRASIRNAVIEFCISLGVSKCIYSEIDFIVTVDGDYFERHQTGF